jgi:predicted acylesterase/phospholipase RssA
MLERWWHDHSLVNGVFKGGGAKGIAYGGALTACDRVGVWFGSVAGASAGAITASAIAAGLSPRDIIDATSDGLKTLKRQRIRLALGISEAYYDSQGLTDWLEGLLRPHTDDPDGVPVTFESLYRATNIVLYVVALDLHTGSPTIFSGHTTPECPVAQAVAASSAIPAAFPSGRALHLHGAKYSVHRLVDGGAWANYPMFVFRDTSFRACLRSLGADAKAQDREDRRPTIGFVLGSKPMPLSTIPTTILKTRKAASEGDLGTLRSSGSPVGWLIGITLSSRALRIIVAVALIVAGWSTLKSLEEPLRGIGGMY